MPDPALSLVFVMDPIESIDVRTDTTFVLMLEAQHRGHRVLTADPADLFVAGGEVSVRAFPVRLRREAGPHAERGPAEDLRLDDADVVLQRKDPPVDAAYTAATQMLALCRRALVLNRPEAILAFNEKLFALHFADLMAETLVTRRLPDLLAFLEKMGGEMIVKPLSGKGGEGIFHVRAGDRNTYSILEQATAFGRTWTMAQRYLPEVRQGDKRILLLDGEPLGALLRVPREGESRANLHVGGLATATRLDADDRRIVERLAPVLRREGLFLVGIDVIGGRLTEINVTSPTGIQEINALDGTTLEARVLDAVEQRASGRGARRTRNSRP